MPLSCLPETARIQQWEWQEAPHGKGCVAQRAGDNSVLALGSEPLVPAVTRSKNFSTVRVGHVQSSVPLLLLEVLSSPFPPS